MRTPLEAHSEPDKESVNRSIFKIIEDLGFEMNYEKAGLKFLLDFIVEGKIKGLVLIHKDRHSAALVIARRICSFSEEPNREEDRGTLKLLVRNAYKHVWSFWFRVIKKERAA